MDWYYAEQGQQRGPVAFEELQALAASGRLRPSDLVWREGLPEWVPASTQPGLFAAPPQSPAPLPPQRPTFTPAYEPRPPFYRPPPPSGGGAGWMVILAGGAVFVLLGVLCCGVFAFIAVTAGGNKSNERTWSLKTGAATHWALPFKKGDKVEIIVTSTGASDMDLFVFRNKADMNAYLNSAGNNPALLRNCIVYDIRDESNCHVTFEAPETQDYYVALVNVRRFQSRDGPNSGKLVFTPAPK